MADPGSQSGRPCDAGCKPAAVAAPAPQTCSALPNTAQAILASPAYAELTSPFERWAALVSGTNEEARALQQAAWLAEDDGGDDIALRRRALAVWQWPVDPEEMVQLADTQRRANLLDDAVATLDRIPATSDDGLARVVAFERSRIALADTGRHLLSSALRPPARTPHVSHGKLPTGGFWRRLFGGATR